MSSIYHSNPTPPANTTTERNRARRDIRPVAIGLLLSGVLLVGILVELVPSRGFEGVTQPADTSQTSGFETLLDTDPKVLTAESESTDITPPKDEIADATAPTTASQDKSKEIKALLTQAIAETKAKRYDDAIRTLNRIQPLDPDLPEAFLRIGEALLGKGDFFTARDFFAGAIDRDPMMASAYFGFASASEGLGDLESALGGMRTYLHVETNKDPYRLKVAQARSAIWEWESKLGRGPWGPTKGVPPGFTADEIKRDGKGTGVKMQKPETLRPDGTMDYEIKSGDRFPELWKE